MQKTVDHMAARNRLTAGFMKRPKPGMHCDGAGLWLRVREDGGAQWVLRVTAHGRKREMGLGGYPAIGLADARNVADRWRAVASAGRNPIKEREAERRAVSRADISLATITNDCFEARKAELKGDGLAGRWLSPITHHVLPKLGKVPVTEIDQRDIVDVIKPLWHDKADAARKALQRLGIILQYAAAMGLDVDLQATAKARALLGTSRHKEQHIPSMKWVDVPAFYASLAEQPTLTHLALRLAILTGVHSKPLRHIRLDQIAGDVWTIPGEGMKGLKDRTDDFRVPLSAEALRVIELATPFARDGFLFPSVNKGVISDTTTGRHMERRGLEARPHGFRTSLRTWLAEVTDAPHDVAETMLAHVTGSKVSRAYKDTDFLEQRRVLIERWADHVTGGSGAVVRLVEAAK